MTVFLSGSFAMHYGFKVTTLNLMLAGGVLFALSDLILSGTYFIEGHGRPADIISNYVLYYAGQYLIALSVYYLLPNPETAQKAAVSIFGPVGDNLS